MWPDARNKTPEVESPRENEPRKRKYQSETSEKKGGETKEKGMGRKEKKNARNHHPGKK